MDPGSGSSELVIYFWDGKNVFDAVEFFLLQKGVAVGTREEVEGWLRKTFDDFVRRRREALNLKNRRDGT